MGYLYRMVSADDADALWEMITYAAHMEGELSAAIATAKSLSFLRAYIDGWGRPEDLGVLATVENGQIIGGAWVRLMTHEYFSRDYARAGIPECAIGVHPDYRGRGVGTALMETLIDACRGRFPAIVLSARRSNPAVHLYERLGFVPVEEIANRVGTASLVMELPLEGNTQ